MRAAVVEAVLPREPDESRPRALTERTRCGVLEAVTPCNEEHSTASRIELRPDPRVGGAGIDDVELVSPHLPGEVASDVEREQDLLRPRREARRQVAV